VKPAVLLLHGALGSKDSLAPLMPLLEEWCTVYPINFAGHGGTAPSTEGMTVDALTRQVIHTVNQIPEDTVWVFGYSMGGYIALNAALQQPSKMAGVITLATKMHWDADIAAAECQKLNPAVVLEKVPKFAEALERMHAPQSWQLLMQHTATFLQELGENNPLSNDNLQSMKLPCCCLLGEEDRMVSWEETLAAAKAMNAESHKLAASAHAFEKTNMPALAEAILNFIRK
jgi:pimeloyl-ACP methyl ester carboxylesterase